MGSFILTSQGKRFPVLSPQESDLDIVDIAAGLSRLCRFTGQLSEAFADDIYSVGQHSCYVHDYLVLIGAEHASFWGLMHDAAEAFLGDTSTPVKVHTPDKVALEKNLERLIIQKYEIPHDMMIEDRVQTADAILCHAEAKMLLTGNDPYWATVNIELPEIDPEFRCWGPKRARDEFLTRFGEI